MVCRRRESKQLALWAVSKAGARKQTSVFAESLWCLCKRHAGICCFLRLFLSINFKLCGCYASAELRWGPQMRGEAGLQFSLSTHNSAPLGGGCWYRCGLMLLWGWSGKLKFYAGVMQTVPDFMSCLIHGYGFFSVGGGFSCLFI